MLQIGARYCNRGKTLKGYRSAECWYIFSDISLVFLIHSTMSRFRKRAPQESVQETGSVPKVVLEQACRTGQLNLSGRELKTVPDEVWKLYARSEDDVNFDSKDLERWWNQVELKKLILASNHLTTLSEDIAVFPALVILDLHDNKLNKLPESIEQLKILDKLDISHNELRSLPDGIVDLKRLSTLLMQHNALESLPKFFGDLANLTTLDCSNNKLEYLPEDWSQITSLQKLNLASNQLLKLPYSICGIPLLSYLDLSGNNLSSLPGDWSNLTSLRELYLRNNKLQSLPNLSECNNLKELYCARNAFVSVSICDIPKSIMILEFRDNKIKIIPENISDLQNLQRIDISNNDISTLPPIMGAMEHIKALNVDGNPMRGIRRDVISKGTTAIMTYLRTRVVTGAVSDNHNEHSQSNLPVSSELAERTKMHELNVSKSLDLRNKPFSPKSLTDLSDIPLETINLHKTGLVEFPDGLSHFQDSLKTLTCSLNKISLLTSIIGNFTSLTHLNLASNSLTSLPTEIENLRKLIELNIMQNKFKGIPVCVYDLPSLEHLLASGNQIESIDAAGLQKLTKLSTLSLQNNSISQVPPELGLVTSLRNLQLEGNMFRIPRHNILLQGTAAVLDYLKGRVPTW